MNGFYSCILIMVNYETLLLWAPEITANRQAIVERRVV